MELIKMDRERFATIESLDSLELKLKDYAKKRMIIDL